MINEKDYPIQNQWLLKALIYACFYPVACFLLAAYASPTLNLPLVGNIQIHWLIAMLSAIAAVFFINTFIKKQVFHYSLDEQCISVKQGLFSPKQSHIVYSKLQDVFIIQDFLDKILGLNTLIVENASNPSPTANRYINFRIGMAHNKLRIPGLSRNDAEALKQAILSNLKKPV
jgi:uncharacterized membrane protein YdbT with pleckstrin-like domain